MLRRLFGWGEKKTATLPPGEAKSGVQAKPAPGVQPVDVWDADFDEVVLHTDKPLVVVDFWAEWCQPCDVVSAHVSHLAQAYADRVLVAAVDVDNNTTIPEQYAVMGLPTLLFLRDGQEVDRHLGVLSYEQLVDKVEACLAA